MNEPADREWDELASLFRTHKKLLPLTAVEADRIFETVDDVDIAQHELDSIIQRAVSHESPATSFAAMSRVRLKGDVSRQGVATGRTQPGRRGKGLRFQVKFPDTSSWIPGDQLELVPAEQESPLDLLKEERLGRAADLRRTLTHFRLSGRLADVIYSMESTNTDFYAYQFKPVLRFLLSPSNALLIADEVGLGKTIEAGLIWTELRSRFDLRRLLVLCPAVLRDKWARELRQKIGVRADIVDAGGLLRTLRDPELAIRGFATIASLQGTRPHRDWELSEEPNSPAQLARFLRSHESNKPLVDLVIIDEAHYLRNPESQTNELGRLIRAVSENLLLLSATPIHNHNQDLFSLLQLLDPDTFERQDDLQQILQASRPLVEARDELLRPNTNGALPRLLEEAQSHPLLRDSRQLALVREQASDPDRLCDTESKAQLARRLELINPLAYVISRTRKRDVSEWRVVREANPEQVPMHPAERSFYDKVTEVVIRYAMSSAVNERFLLATPQRQMSSSMPASLRAWQQRRDNIDDLAAASLDGSSAKTSEIGPLTRELVDNADAFGDVDELTTNDSKYQRVHSVLKGYFAKHSEEKVILFSTFRATLDYLGERLAADNIPNAIMHGGIDVTKEEVLSRFEGDPQVRVLLSSEVGSEGIDLQFCRVLINYDLPWNPMRVEQRIGRLDRIGQAASKILIWNLFYEETIDALIYNRLYEKLGLCRQALGDFEAILGDEMRRLTTDLLSDRLNREQQAARVDQTAQALANLKDEQEQLEQQASHLIAYGDYILNQVRAAKELHRWINGDDLRSYVTDFFRMQYQGCEFRQVKEGVPDYDVSLTPLAKSDLEEFIRSNRLSSRTKLLRNTTGHVKCRFENKTAESKEGQREIISQFHPVVRFVSDCIRRSEEQLSPAVSVSLDWHCVEEQKIDQGHYLLAVSRWSIDGLHTMERLAFAAATLDGDSKWNRLNSELAERLASACAQHGEDWFDARSEIDIQQAASFADDELFGELDERYQEFVDDVKRQNEDRADLQLRNLGRHRTNQLSKLFGVRQRHEMLGRDAQVKMTDGRIEALERRIAQKEQEIEKRRQTSDRSEEILVALVRVE